MQVDAVMILLASLVVPPLAPVLLIARLVLLHRRARSLRYMLF
jgi:hypothetical protein